MLEVAAADAGAAIIVDVIVDGGTVDATEAEDKILGQKVELHDCISSQTISESIFGTWIFGN